MDIICRKRLPCMESRLVTASLPFALVFCSMLDQIRKWQPVFMIFWILVCSTWKNVFWALGLFKMLLLYMQVLLLEIIVHTWTGPYLLEAWRQIADQPIWQFVKNSSEAQNMVCLTEEKPTSSLNNMAFGDDSPYIPLRSLLSKNCNWTHPFVDDFPIFTPHKNRGFFVQLAMFWLLDDHNDQTWSYPISPIVFPWNPSGKRLHNYGKSPFLMGTLTINGNFQ